MAKLKGKGVVLAAFVAGVASFLSKKDNRVKTMNMINSIKDKAGAKLNLQKSGATGTGDTLKELAETAASVSDTNIRGNNFIGEGGGQTALAYYNESQQKQ
ncbi:hypothetical protein CD30_04355 [Ureibacillus massiliensis 4400831 = CIP 108448 = CCUG 49529]|uniref:Uncharacterized protein n=1 Tax=Ureibacillus massiliensis 4400831 = CIP 108448 = CCUG 49529 TaxID=1211035 RepID=A0A0A3J483_9BACL|nr:hypothetical protein [Ureibacillus massiliensis]KGR91814.1 hypothetical protein CD30_04355 [Ureibacillus massiliensis 4400831 = CIP 108448 = CCUG 49529]RKJ59871.1 hypothetical protein D7X33_28775 [Butyricicoccus sp. 1XD8-22]